MHRDGHPHARVRPGELLEHEDVGEEVGARAAVLLGNAHTHQPELGELRVELVGKTVLAVPRGRVRDDLGLGQLPRETLDLPLIRGELEVHGPDYRLAATRLTRRHSRAWGQAEA